MTNIRVLSTVVALGVSWGLTPDASAWDREHARIFAVLPDGSGGPEGLEVDPRGNVYVSSFGFTSARPLTGPGQIFVYDDGGRLLRRLEVAGASPHLLGLHWRAATGTLLVADFGNQQVLEVDPMTGGSKVFMTLPAPPLPHGAGTSLNDITVDSAGNVYVSDSFQGIVWRTGSQGGVASAWADSELLRTTGVPPFGGNGLRFNRSETALLVANTGNDTVVKIPVVGGAPGGTGVAGTPAVFVNGINGADGLIVDDVDNVWVVANQADEIVVVDPSGRAIAKLGDFGGVRDGVPRQLLFPASLRFSRGRLLVTNLALDLRLAVGPEAVTVDSPWCAEVSRYTISSLPAQIPGASRPGDHDRDPIDGRGPPHERDPSDDGALGRDR